jgi:uncharacterized protein (TIGR03085 family)
MDTASERTLTASERHALCDLIDELGPEAPTLCQGWATRDLAAHLVLRERRADAAPGILLPVMAGYTARVQGRIAQLPWKKLLDLVRNGPPWWSPLSLPVLDRHNALELFVHHEDVRRAQPGWKPRPGDARRASVLWELLGPLAWVLYRNSPVGVVLRTPEGVQRTVRRAQRFVTLIGPPEELILHAFGRDRAVVDADGDQADVAKLQGSPRGL